MGGTSPLPTLPKTERGLRLTFQLWALASCAAIVIDHSGRGLTQLVSSETRPVATPARKQVKHRAFFVGLGLFAIAIALIAFVPEYWRSAAGRFPIPLPLHLHGALMAAWLATFVLQALLVSRGQVTLHRTIGPWAVGLGVAVWGSMVFVAVRRLVVHPLPLEWAGYDELLQDVYTDTTFIALLLWAIYERRRPAWHKRLLAVAIFVTLLAPVERLEWLPELGIGFIWASALWLDLGVVAALVGYDLILARRLHPATMGGLALLLAAQATTVLAWGSAPWRHFAFLAAHALRSAFGGEGGL